MSLHQFGAYTDQFGIGPGCFYGQPGLVLMLEVIPIAINICAYLIKSEIRISKSETSTNDQKSNDKNHIKLRPSSIVHRPSRLRRAHFIITFGISCIPQKSS